MNKGQEVIHCKKCGSNRITRVPVILILFLSGSCFLWIPIIGWIAAPILFLLALLMAFLPSGKRIVKCEDCKHSFPVDNKVYKEFKEAIK
ncbi:hypothetical protein [Cytobacillus sp.]|uniref:hypothetical protein n=1 Tax=Cytobacillus sp. TaxID=2675269 RepID=UPI0035159B53